MKALFVRDVRIAARAGGGALAGLLFFLAVVAALPFAVGPDLKLLARIGPAMLWTGALLASLLGLDRLFQQDREDGSLDLLAIADWPLEAVVFVKCAAHWFASGLPLVAASPLFGMLLGMEAEAILATAATLLAGTPAIAFVGAGAAAAAVAMPRGGLLIAVLVLPMAIPVLIFGVSAALGAVEDPAPFLQPFLILIALSLLFAVLGPLAAAAILRGRAD
jgi:heme exporter protein B